MNEYSLLSTIYKILGETSKETLNKVENCGEQPKEILTIVQALRDARIAMDAKNKNKKKDEKIFQKKAITLSQDDAFETSWGTNSRRLWNSLQKSLTDQKKHKFSNKSIVDAFTQSGLDTKARGKEGRQKMLMVIQASLDAIEDSKRIKVLDNVVRILGLSQTKGWMEVIKSKNN